MEPSKKLKTVTGEGLAKLPNGQPIPATLPPEQVNMKSKSKQSEKLSHQKICRKAGEEEWVDKTLLDWSDNDYRIFIGNLGSEVNEEVLRKAFSRFPSIQKIKVIRDKGTQRSKGYGFISFLSPEEYLQAFKEMNGKFIGSQPITMKKSDWKKKSMYKK